MHDDRLAGFQPVHHLDLAALALADGDDAALHLAVLHRIDEVAQAFADDGLLRHHDGIVLGGHFERHRQEHAGLEGLVRIVELGGQARRAGGLVDAGIDGRNAALEDAALIGGGGGVDRLARLEAPEKIFRHREVETDLATGRRGR